MQFTKQSILDFDLDLLSLKEKKYLLKKYFPEELSAWKTQLHCIGKELQYKRLWSSYRGEHVYGDFDKEYRHTAQDIERLAKVFGNNETLTRIKSVRVTDFTKWVMSLYLGPPNPASLARGKHVERSVARMAKPSEHPEWEVVYRDPLYCAPTPLKISSLTFNGDPLWGAPDLVYRNLCTGDLLIVERKASDRPIPVDGWPNLRAQLWAYGHIDDYADSPKITLIGEVWGTVNEHLARRGILRWSRTDKEFDAENMELFSLYGGVRHA